MYKLISQREENTMLSVKEFPYAHNFTRAASMVSRRLALRKGDTTIAKRNLNNFIVVLMESVTQLTDPFTFGIILQ